MPTLQKSFDYRGDSATPLIRTINVIFDVPVFDYFDAGGDKEGRLVERTMATTKEIRIAQAIDAKNYRVDLGNDFAIGPQRPDAYVMVIDNFRSKCGN